MADILTKYDYKKLKAYLTPSASRPTILGCELLVSVSFNKHTSLQI